MKKTLHFLRHGSALHNINAEPLRAAGCSFQEFLDQMKVDDAFDAALTPAGVQQAIAAGSLPPSKAAAASLQLVVTSPLSRAIDTADLVFPANSEAAPRLMHESLREITGWLLNGKRRTRSELSELYPEYDQGNILTDEDVLWKPEELESDKSVRARANSAIEFIWNRPETTVAVVAHGGLLKNMLCGNPFVRTVTEVGRFENCEMKTCTLQWNEGDGVFDVEEIKEE